MSLKQEILKKLKEAMKSRETETLKTLRLLHSGIKNKEIELRPQELKESDVLAVLKKQIKQSKESLDFFEKAGREDEIQKNKQELSVLETLLPKAPSDEELKTIVLEVIRKINAQSFKDMGRVMKEAVSRTGGLADGKKLSEIVKQALSD